MSHGGTGHHFANTAWSILTAELDAPNCLISGEEEDESRGVFCAGSGVGSGSCLGAGLGFGGGGPPQHPPPGFITLGAAVARLACCGAARCGAAGCDGGVS